MASLEMLSGRSKKENAKETQTLADDPDGAPATNGAAESDLEAVVACDPSGGGLVPTDLSPEPGQAPRKGST